MANPLRNWVGPRVEKELEFARQTLSGDFSLDKGLGKDVMSYEDGLLSVQLDKTRQVQIIKLKSADPQGVLKVTVTDGITNISATFRSTCNGAREFVKSGRPLREIEGGSIGLKGCALVFDSKSRSSDRLYLEISEFKFIGDGSGSLGGTTPIAKSQKVQMLLFNIEDAISTNATKSRPCSVSPILAQGGKMGQLSSTQTDGSQAMFATQIPIQVQQRQPGVNVFCATKSAQPADSLLNLLHPQQKATTQMEVTRATPDLAAKHARNSPLKPQARDHVLERASQLSERANKAHSQFPDGSHESKASPTPLKALYQAMPIAQSDSAEKNSPDKVEHTKVTRAKLPNEAQVKQNIATRSFVDQFQQINPFGGLKRIPKNYVRVTEAQKKLLLVSWYKPEVETRNRHANIPAEVQSQLQGFGSKSFPQKPANPGEQDIDEREDLGSVDSESSIDDAEQEEQDATGEKDQEESSKEVPTISNRKSQQSIVSTADLSDKDSEISWPATPRDIPEPEAVPQHLQQIVTGGHEVRSQVEEVPSPMRTSQETRREHSQKYSTTHLDGMCDHAPSAATHQEVASKLSGSQGWKPFDSSSAPGSEARIEYAEPHVASDFAEEDSSDEVEEQQEAEEEEKEYSPVFPRTVPSTAPGLSIVVQVKQTPMLERRKRMSADDMSDGLIPRTFQEPRSSTHVPSSKETVLSPGQATQPKNENDRQGQASYNLLNPAIATAQRDNCAPKRCINSIDPGSRPGSAKRQQHTPKGQLEQHKTKDAKTMARSSRHVFKESLTALAETTAIGHENKSSFPAQCRIATGVGSTKSLVANGKVNVDDDPVYNFQSLGTPTSSIAPTRRSTSQRLDDPIQLVANERSEVGDGSFMTYPCATRSCAQFEADDNEMEKSADQAFFHRFTSIYPSYCGSEKDFIRALVYIEYLENNKFFVSRFICDDFIRVHASEYLQYLRQSQGEGKEVAISGWEFYHKHVASQKYRKEVITPDNLQAAISSLDSAYIGYTRAKYNIPVAGTISTQALPTLNIGSLTSSQAFEPQRQSILSSHERPLITDGKKHAGHLRTTEFTEAPSYSERTSAKAPERGSITPDQDYSPRQRSPSLELGLTPRVAHPKPRKPFFRTLSQQTPTRREGSATFRSSLPIDHKPTTTRTTDSKTSRQLPWSSGRSPLSSPSLRARSANRQSIRKQKSVGVSESESIGSPQPSARRPPILGPLESSSSRVSKATSNQTNSVSKSKILSRYGMAKASRSLDIRSEVSRVIPISPVPEPVNSQPDRKLAPATSEARERDVFISPPQQLLEYTLQKIPRPLSSQGSGEKVTSWIAKQGATMTQVSPKKVPDTNIHHSRVDTSQSTNLMSDKAEKLPKARVSKKEPSFKEFLARKLSKGISMSRNSTPGRGIGNNSQGSSRNDGEEISSRTSTQKQTVEREHALSL